MDGDRPPPAGTAEARLLLDLPAWVLDELERYSRECPGETLDRFVSELLRRWAAERRAQRAPDDTPVPFPARRHARLAPGAAVPRAATG